jgi:hypothetical protein
VLSFADPRNLQSNQLSAKDLSFNVVGNEGLDPEMKLKIPVQLATTISDAAGCGAMRPKYCVAADLDAPQANLHLVVCLANS